MNQIEFIEEGHKYFHNGKKVSCVSDILEHFGISDFSKVNSRVLEAACEFGKNVHKTCELYDKNDLASCDPEIEPYLEGWKKFKKEIKVPEFYLIEQPMYSKTWGFAGTPDRVILGNMGKAILPDIKSGAEYVAHRIQTAFYQILVEENHEIIRIKHRWGVYLKPNDYKIVPHEDKGDISIAKSLIQLYNFKRREKLL